MIRVDRKAVPVPADLDGDGSLGGKERKKTLDFYADPQNGEKPYEHYAAYKAKSVIEALEKLFRGKCAYCESRYDHLQPVDVEHFRPKGGVAVADPTTGKMRLQRPGYYWLAAIWENLLPSCIDCNRERTHEFSDEEEPGKSGKANKFPLAGKRPKLVQGCEQGEKTLLLDPCQDDPDRHLEFTEEGAVRPALSKGRPSRHGKASIEVYGLQRKPLMQVRRDRALMIRAQIERIRFLEGKANQYRDDPDFWDAFAREIALLKGLLQAEQAYAGMARQLVRRLYGPVPF
jgi:uncharacterized protein (TIGR02646 family)